MKRTFPLLVVAGMLMLGITACKEKKQSEDIIIAKYVPEGPKSPIRMSAEQRVTPVNWQGKDYQVIISRTASDSLPKLVDETGQEYYDNSISLQIMQGETVKLKKHFTKNAFASYIDDDFRKKGFLENMVFQGVEDGKLKFGAVVSRPGSDDEFVPLDVFIDCTGGMTIALGKLFDIDTEEEN